MSVLNLRFLILAFFWATLTMALKARDAIHLDDLDNYDVFLSNLTDSQFLDMYLEDSHVKIDVYENPTNEIAITASFTPSHNATEYFRQTSALADEKFPLAETSSDSASGSVVKRAGCSSLDSVQERDIAGIENQNSRCYQFCGTIANCRNNNGCPHCYAVRQGCLWQKWCR
ncbi:hypothetical protein N7495_001457 [Penicillium taxi]|uniref:uncharacterized protein n=1 Tax=Penicillium taxi TaxID=168475 RepID=UPI0025459728|nr:uncharacterized protein N7495_001457 [Penicillium taxi]KAJ5908775.1 hypothetical protein N7495_001457 [Penicillium taxi]